MKYVIAAMSVLCGAAQAQPAIEAYGDLPEIRSMALSADGQQIAFLSNREGRESLIVYKFGGQPIAFGTNDIKSRSVSFIGNDYVILRASDFGRYGGFWRGEAEFSAAFSVSVKNKSIVQLLINSPDLYTGQSGFGSILGLHGEKEVLMPAYAGLHYPPPRYLFKVDLDNGRGRIFDRGNEYTIDWIVDRGGKILAKEQFDNSRSNYKILTEIDGGWATVYEESGITGPTISLAGVTKDHSKLVVYDGKDNEGGEFATVRYMDFDGRVSPPVFQRLDAGVDGMTFTHQRELLGVRYSGNYPDYEYLDKSVDATITALQAKFPGNAVWLEDFNEDFSIMLLLVEGSNYAGDYFLYDSKKNTLARIGQQRPSITPEHIGQVMPIEYKARDGLIIPAILTMPSNGETQNLPLIVMPHGGPELYDSVGFDWMAQYFASRGYMVLQPNFRGSDGFGRSFTAAGYGEWGGKMQDDVTDGVNSLIQSGRADPNRICIVGASYGGYASLAGGAFTPDLYQCVVAVAPVSDLRRMLITERTDFGRNSGAYRYWKKFIGDLDSESDKIKELSPINHARAYRAPVLLIHGKHDLVVPIEHSRTMKEALSRVGADVELVELDGEDHWLSNGGTRLETLRLMSAFVEKHIGGK